MRLPIKVVVQGGAGTTRFPKHVTSLPHVGQRISALHTSSGGGVPCYEIKEVIHGYDDSKKIPIIYLIVNKTDKKMLKLE